MAEETEPKMQGVGSAFEFNAVGVDFQGPDVHRSIRTLNKWGAEGWEVMFFYEGRVYLKRKILTALEQKSIDAYNASVAQMEARMAALIAGPPPKNTH